MSRFRKAIAAFVVGLLSLPVVNWIDGTEAFDTGKLWAALGVALVSAVTVYLTPNQPPA